MEPSSRTPEGEPNQCPVCGKPVLIDPSRPPGDAPCPHCGHLLWFELPPQNLDERESVEHEEAVRELVEPARQRFNKEESVNLEARLRQGEFTLADFKKMIGQTKKLGPLDRILGVLPGMGGISQTLSTLEAKRAMQRLTGIIDAMTPAERRNPRDTLDESRRRRVATGAGVTPTDVNSLVEQFDSLAGIMRKLAGMRMRDRMR
jgi:signal recognition particle GTPase